MYIYIGNSFKSLRIYHQEYFDSLNLSFRKPQDLKLVSSKWVNKLLMSNHGRDTVRLNEYQGWASHEGHIVSSSVKTMVSEL